MCDIPTRVYTILLCIDTNYKLLCDVSHDTPTSILLCVIHLQECTLYYYVYRYQLQIIMCDVSHDTPTSILLCVIHLQECTLYYYV